MSSTVQSKGRSINRLLEHLKNGHSTCTDQVCCDLHWTLLIQKFVRNLWTIYFIASLLQGSQERMRQWHDLFAHNDLFSGTWIKLKIILQQSWNVVLRCVCMAYALHFPCLMQTKLVISLHASKSWQLNLDFWSHISALMETGTRDGSTQLLAHQTLLSKSTFLC